MKESVRKFNTIAGKLDASELNDKEKMWEALESAAKRVLEEAEEMLEAAKNRDILEYLDGLVDVKYTEAHSQLLLEVLGIDVVSAGEEVCKNNNLKFFTSLDEAKATAEHYNMQGQECYVEGVNYEGESLLVVKRIEDNKVMKPVNHPSPDIRTFIPDSACQLLYLEV